MADGDGRLPEFFPPTSMSLSGLFWMANCKPSSAAIAGLFQSRENIQKRLPAYFQEIHQTSRIICIVYGLELAVVFPIPRLSNTITVRFEERPVRNDGSQASNSS
jgi:hypothetical protein